MQIIFSAWGRFNVKWSISAIIMSHGNETGPFASVCLLFYYFAIRNMTICFLSVISDKEKNLKRVCGEYYNLLPDVFYYRGLVNIPSNDDLCSFYRHELCKSFNHIAFIYLSYLVTSLLYLFFNILNKL